MVTNVAYLLGRQLTASVIASLRTRAEDVKSKYPNISSLPWDFPDSYWLSPGEIAFQVQRKGSESVVIDIENLMEWLNRMVRFENPHSIREYLLRFTELLDVIPQAVDAAKKYFPKAQLVMNVYQDPEIADCYLVLFIRLKHYDDSVIERLEKAEAEYLNQLVNKKGWIQLTTDFSEPEGEYAL
jgi:hypothetical protein